MNSSCIDKQKLIEVIKCGVYYNPAYKHYGQDGIVFCDRCRKQDLSVCIGYEMYDLCLQCVQEEVDKKDKISKCPCAQTLHN